MSEINWSSLKTQADDAVKPLDPGRYRFQVVRPEVKQSSTGKWMIVVHLIVQGGPKHGKDLMNNFVLTPDSAFSMNRWFANFEALGLDESFWQKMSEQGLLLEQSLQQVANAIDGRLVEADVDVRDYANRKVNDFKTFFAVTGQSPVTPGLPTTGNNIPRMAGVPSGVPSIPNVVTTPATPAVPPAPVIPPAPVVSAPVTPPTTISAPPEEPF